jgi:tetratricopeptide (TPR) repeat protein
MRSVALLIPLLAGCATAPPAWTGDSLQAFGAARAARGDCVVYFALPGRALSDRMQQQALPDAAVLAALRAGAFHSLWLDGVQQSRLYEAWIGSGEGMGVCALDGEGRVYGARPGPQDAPELAAWLRLCAARRDGILAARRELAQRRDDRRLQLQLAARLLELGCRRETEELLIASAMAGELEARHLLARLAALEGRLQVSRQWLLGVPRTPGLQVTEGYLLYKERRHAEAAAVLEQALGGELGAERQRAQLYCGKALHEAGRSDEARRVLQALIGEAAGSTFAAAAMHTLQHIDDPAHPHSH